MALSGKINSPKAWRLNSYAWHLCCLVQLFVVWVYYLLARTGYRPIPCGAVFQTKVGKPPKGGVKRNRRHTMSSLLHLLRYASLGGNPTTIPATSPTCATNLHRFFYFVQIRSKCSQQVSYLKGMSIRRDRVEVAALTPKIFLLSVDISPWQQYSLLFKARQGT